MTLLLALALAAAGQASPRAESRPLELDPYLWDEISSAVAAASEAELDPKRGPDNAREILLEAKAKLPDRRLATAVDLRLAGVFVRQHFLASEKFTVPIRRAQVLSTYSRLDLAEPGFREALDAALDAKHGAKKPDLHIDVAVLARDRSFDKAAFEKKLAAGLSRLGVNLHLTGPSKANFLLKLGARDAAADGDRRLVGVRLDIEHVESGEISWRHGMFRASEAASMDAALDAGLDWLARIGGRDLLFRALATGPLPDLKILGAPGADSHDGHRH